MTEPGSLSFPDGPRTELEAAISSLIAQSERVLRAQGRLRALLRATQAVMEQSDLTQVLRSIVEAAIELVGAQFGAMGVINAEQDGLEQFVYVGLSAEDAAAIGHLPTGRGLLGALITDPHPIRLAHIADDERSVGFPAHHPPMESFLGVPVRVRGEVFGNLYLTNAGSRDFTEEDEQLVEALALTAGFAIENARLLAETRIRARWMTAAAELSAGISSTPTDTALDLIVNRVRDVSGADQVTVLIPNPQDGRLQVGAATGPDEAILRGAAFEPSSSFAGRVLDDACRSLRSRSSTPPIGIRSSSRTMRSAVLPWPSRCARTPSSGASSASPGAPMPAASPPPRPRRRQTWPLVRASRSNSRGPARRPSERSSRTTGGGSPATCMITSSSSSSVPGWACRPSAADSDQDPMPTPSARRSISSTTPSGRSER